MPLFKKKKPDTVKYTEADLPDNAEIPESPERLNFMVKAARDRALGLAEKAIRSAYQGKRIVIDKEGWEYTDKQGKKESYSNDGLSVLFWGKLDAELSHHSMGGYSANFGVLGINVNDILNIILKIKSGG
jgi:hypothetical protein